MTTTDFTARARELENELGNVNAEIRSLQKTRGADWTAEANSAPEPAGPRPHHVAYADPAEKRVAELEWELARARALTAHVRAGRERVAGVMTRRQIVGPAE